MLPDPGHVGHDALRVVADREPVDVRRLGGAGAGADVVEALRSQRRGVQAAGEQVAHDGVGEELHAAVGVVDDEPLGGAEQLVGDDQRADRVIAGPAAGVADDVRVALGQPGVLGRVEPGVHAGQDREAACWRQGQLGLGAERCGVRRVGLEDLVEHGHGGLAFAQMQGRVTGHYNCEFPIGRLEIPAPAARTLDRVQGHGDVSTGGRLCTRRCPSHDDRTRVPHRAGRQPRRDRHPGVPRRVRTRDSTVAVFPSRTATPSTG